MPMPTSEQLEVLQLLRMSFSVNADTSLQGSISGVSNIILRNGILLTVYPKIKKLAEGERRAELKELEQELRPRYLAGVKQAILQGYEGDCVLQALTDVGFDCIALKGWELRKLYPEPAMRQMADLDILVRPYDFEKIKTVMRELGYSGGSESSWKHDTFKKNTVTVEIHKRLTDDSDMIQRWEKEMWRRAKFSKDHQYQMSEEDFYIFHFVHLHKDFMNGSLGLRRIVDTWLLQKQPVDRALVEHEFSEMGLSRFHEKMVKLSRVTMGEEEMDEDSEILLAHAFRFGIYGSDKAYKAGRIASMGGSVKSGKLKSWLKAIFLPMKRMKAQYPILARWPVLLPYYWMKRIARFLGGNMAKNKRMLNYSVSVGSFRP